MPEKTRVAKRRRRDNMSYHILPASTALIGVAATVLTLFLYSGLGKSTLIDEFLAVCAMIFSVSTFLSYLSIRRDDTRLETLADILFFTGLVILNINGVLLILALR